MRKGRAPRALPLHHDLAFKIPLLKGHRLRDLLQGHTFKAHLQDLLVRKKKLSLRAADDGVFVTARDKLFAGTALPGGFIAGHIHSGSVFINAYALDHQLGRLAPGMKVKIRLKDGIKDFRGTIVRITPVPVSFQESPLLHLSGGSIVVKRIPGKPGWFAPEHALFRIDIEPDDKIPFQTGRSLRVIAENRELLFDKFKAGILYFFRSEF